MHSQIIYGETQKGPVRIPGLHDPSSILDYGFDFTDWLSPGSAIASANWSASNGIVLGSGIYTESHSSTIAIVWVVSANITQSPGIITVKILTDETPPKQQDFSIRLEIGER